MYVVVLYNSRKCNYLLNVMVIISLYIYMLSAVKTWRICRKSSLIQISPFPQLKTGHREITISGFVKPHKWSQDLYFNENNHHIYLAGATLIFFSNKINRQQIFAAPPQPCSLQGFFLFFFFSEHLVLCECEL